MQAIRSLISRFVSASTVTTVPMTVQQPTPLTEQDLSKVAGGLPYIGGFDPTQPGGQPTTAA